MGSHPVPDTFLFFFLASYSPIVRLLYPSSKFWTASYQPHIFITVVASNTICWSNCPMPRCLEVLSHYQVLVDPWGCWSFRHFHITESLLILVALSHYLPPWILDSYILWTGWNSYCIIPHLPLQKYQQLICNDLLVRGMMVVQSNIHMYSMLHMSCLMGALNFSSTVL